MVFRLLVRGIYAFKSSLIHCFHVRVLNCSTVITSCGLIADCLAFLFFISRRSNVSLSGFVSSWSHCKAIIYAFDPSGASSVLLYCIFFEFDLFFSVKANIYRRFV